MATPVAYLKTILVGRPKPTGRLEQERVTKRVGLAVFASDNLSSSAYATEEMMLVLVLGGAAALLYSVPTTLVIVVVYAIIVFSYRQTILAYPTGAGAYTVAQDNLGRQPGVVAASALLIDYVLTVAVSIAAATAAVVAALPQLYPSRVQLAVLAVLFVAMMHLRGVAQSRPVFAVPTYAFLFFLGSMLVWGFVRVAVLGHEPRPAPDMPAAQGITFFLLLRAFSHGSTAVTGVEAISSGVPSFRGPQARNAAITLTIMGMLLASLILGIAVLARVYGVVGPDEERHLTLVAAIALEVFGPNPMFYLVQVSTALILVLAASTAYSAFPLLSATLAKDRFAPRQLMNRGDRLAYSNGILALTALASALIVIFNADVTRLIQLYLVGVFTSLTLSQSGMVKHWHELRASERRWLRHAWVNGIGASATFVVLCIVIVTKFFEGAWMVVIAIALLVAWLNTTHRHYQDFSIRLRDVARRPSPAGKHVVAMLVSEFGPEERRALAYARLLGPDELHCVRFGSLASSPGLVLRWAVLMPEANSLHVVPVTGRLDNAVRSFLGDLRARTAPTDFVTVVIPEKFTGGALASLRNRNLFFLKASLLFTADVVVADIPYLEGREQITPSSVASFRHVVLVAVSAVHNATLVALEYAKTMTGAELRALHVQIDRDESARVVRDWDAWSPGVPLRVLESPYRDLSRTMLDYVRNLTADKRTIVTIIIPEFTLDRWWHHLLHNQSSLELKRTFLLEPNVVVTSIPYAVHPKPRARGRLSAVGSGGRAHL